MTSKIKMDPSFRWDDDDGLVESPLIQQKSLRIASQAFMFRVTRTATADEEAVAARDNGTAGETSVGFGVVDSYKSFFRSEFLAFHLTQCGVVDGQDAQLGIGHLLVQFAVSLVKLLELGVGLHKCVDFGLRLFFEHFVTSFSGNTNAPTFAGTGRWLGSGISGCGGLRIPRNHPH
jgi:hypothetical protein